MTMSTHALAFALALVLAACTQAPKQKDPKVGTVITMEDVDDAHAELVTGDRVRVPVNRGDAMKGAAAPLVTIVEFSDFQCPFCGTFARTLDEVAAAYPDDVRIVFKHFPLPMHQDAAVGAQATVAAQAQGWFWAMHDTLFANRHKMKREHCEGYAKDLGMDMDAFAAAMDDPQTKRRVDIEKALGRQLSVRGTPSFFINGRFNSGALDPAKLRDEIERERELARKLIDAGSKREEVYARIMRASRVPGSKSGKAAKKPEPAPASDEPAAAPEG